jgi:hypothetical protein
MKMHTFVFVFYLVYFVKKKLRWDVAACTFHLIDTYHEHCYILLATLTRFRISVKDP